MANTDAILSELIDQRDRLTAAIQALSGTVRRAGRPPRQPGNTSRRTGRRMSADAKRRLSEAAKARWAKAKKAGKNSL